MAIQIANGESGASARAKINALLRQRVDVTYPDFNADPSGGSDSTSAIQAAINFCLAQGGGQVYFPPGAYQITAPLVTTAAAQGDNRIELVGVGGFRNSLANGSRLFGNYNDYLMDTTNASFNAPIGRIHGLSFQNNHPTGKCLLIANIESLEVAHCVFSGFYGAIVKDSGYLPSFLSCHFDSSRAVGSIGLCAGLCMVHGSNFQGLDHAIRLFGQGASVLSSRFEVNNTAIVVGMDSTGAGNIADGVTIAANQFEKNRAGISVVLGSSVFIQGNDINGTTGPNSIEQSSPGVIYTVTGNTSSPTNTLVLTSTAGLTNGMFIGVQNDGGLKIPPNTTITVSGSTITLSRNTTATIFAGDGLVFAATQNDLWSGVGINSTTIDTTVIIGNTISIRGNVGGGGIVIPNAQRTTLLANTVVMGDASIPAYGLPSNPGALNNTFDFSNNIDPAVTLTAAANTGGVVGSTFPAAPTITVNSGSPQTLTIRSNDQVQFSNGFTFDVVQMGTGQVTITTDNFSVPVTIQSKGATASAPKISGQYGKATCRKTGLNQWLITGDLV